VRAQQRVRGGEKEPGKEEQKGEHEDEEEIMQWDVKLKG
jgi:hypothetical protein